MSRGPAAGALARALAVDAGAPPFEPVSRLEPLRAQVVDQIIARVRDGRVPVGERLATERELALQFRVSRTVIRDALRVLEAEGVVTVQHGRGIFVTDPADRYVAYRLIGPLLGPRELRELFQFRLTVEVAVAGLAAQAASDDECGRLLEAARAALALGPDDSDAFAAADHLFHSRVTAMAHNAVFTQVTTNLLDLLAASRRTSLGVPGRARTSMTEHWRIARLIAARDVDGARAAMTFHLVSVQETVGALDDGAEGSVR